MYLTSMDDRDCHSQVNRTTHELVATVIDTFLPFSSMVEGHVKMAESQLFGKTLTTPQKL